MVPIDLVPVTQPVSSRRSLLRFVDCRHAIIMLIAKKKNGDKGGTMRYLKKLQFHLHAGPFQEFEYSVAPGIVDSTDHFYSTTNSPTSFHLLSWWLHSLLSYLPLSNSIEHTQNLHFRDLFFLTFFSFFDTNERSYKQIAEQMDEWSEWKGKGKKGKVIEGEEELKKMHSPTARTIHSIEQFKLPRYCSLISVRPFPIHFIAILYFLLCFLKCVN